MAKAIRPTKKQQQILSYIESFIAEHGYSPSYREIMNGLDYTSVATVSLHVNSLIDRGHLRKRDHSARSLEVVATADIPVAIAMIKPKEEKWLITTITERFDTAETTKTLSQQEIDNLYVLVGALKVLGFEDAARSFITRLSALTASPKTEDN